MVYDLRQTTLTGVENRKTGERIMVTAMVLTKEEQLLLELMRSLEYGEICVAVENRKPIRIEEIRQSIQLTAERTR